MASPYLSQITMFGGNFAPKNYALCNGQLLSIQQNAALFSLLGTMYGGNGVVGTPSQQRYPSAGTRPAYGTAAPSSSSYGGMSVGSG